MRPTKGVKCKRPFDEVAQEYELVCDCFGSTMYSHLVYCDVCGEAFHDTCYMLSSNLAKHEDLNFVCYSCRKPGDYSFVNFGVTTKPDQVLIKSLMTEVKKDVNGSILNNFIGAKINRNSPVFQTFNQYYTFEKLCALYDLTSFAKGEGSLFHLIESEVKAKGRMYLNTFESLGVCNRVKFAICLIGHCHRTWCPPIYAERRFSELNTSEDIGSILQIKVFMAANCNQNIAQSVKKI